MKDFFISYNWADKQWAEWIAWTLEEAGYSVVIQAWDFRPGGNFVLDMQRAAAETQKTIAVLSESYLDSAFTQPEWAAAFANDPQSLERKLIPIRVENCKPTGMLRPIVYVDLVGLSEAEAKLAVLNMLDERRPKPEQKPVFPGAIASSEREVPAPVAFPGVAAQPSKPNGNTQSGLNIDRKQLREALISAFPDKADLEMMLLDEMNVKLNTVADGRTYKETVFNLVKWAESQGLLKELIGAARRTNSGNVELHQLAKALE
jgi:predicted component of type VI protein secretion system